MVIDFHTHCFPDHLAGRVIPQLEQLSGLKSDTDGTLSGLKHSMAEAGIAVSLLLPIAQRAEHTSVINTCAIANDRVEGIRSMGSIHPDTAGWESELQRIKDAGLLGIKLHPDFQGVDLDDTRMVAVMAKAVELGLWIVVHGGFDISFPEVRRSTPKKMYDVLPELRGGHIICAHSGGFGYLDDVERYLVGHEEIYIDTSFSIGIEGMDSQQLKRIYNAFDPTHIFFGTDTPWYSQKKALDDFMRFDISDDLKEKILYKNALMVLNATSQAR